MMHIKATWTCDQCGYQDIKEHTIVRVVDVHEDELHEKFCCFLTEGWWWRKQKHLCKKCFQDNARGSL